MWSACNAVKVERSSEYLGVIVPLAFIIRCHGTLPLWNGRSVFWGRCLRHTPTCLLSSDVLHNHTSSFKANLQTLDIPLYHPKCRELAFKLRAESMTWKASKSSLTSTNKPRNMTIRCDFSVRNFLHGLIDCGEPCSCLLCLSTWHDCRLPNP